MIGKDLYINGTSGREEGGDQGFVFIIYACTKFLAMNTLSAGTVLMYSAIKKHSRIPEKYRKFLFCFIHVTHIVQSL
jgi:hypothetical protein